MNYNYRDDWIKRIDDRRSEPDEGDEEELDADEVAEAKAERRYDESKGV